MQPSDSTVRAEHAPRSVNWVSTVPVKRSDAGSGDNREIDAARRALERHLEEAGENREIGAVPKLSVTRSSTRSRSPSTADPARPSAGEPLPKSSMISYTLLTKALLRRTLEPSQYLSIRYTERLGEAGVAPSVGSRGDSYDNALAESVIGLFKTEVIRRRGPWRNLEEYRTRAR